MNDPTLTPAGAGGKHLNILQSNPIMTRVGGVLLLTLLLVVLLAALAARSAEAQSIRASCNIYATNQVDPIAFAQHLHRQFGNTSTTNESTGESLYASKATSCTKAPWLTNAAWVPVERYESVPNVIVYYRAPGDQTKVVDMPRGLQLLGNKTLYNCGASPGDTSPTQSTPPYSCQGNWATQVRFPACWNGWGLEETATIYGATRSTCPATHPVRIPEVNFLVRHPNTDSKVPNPLQVSAGVDKWEDYTHTHADYFYAPQDEFTRDVDLDGDRQIEHTDGGYSEKNLMDLCLRDAPDALEFANARCRADGLLSWHVKAINNYYN